MLVYVPGTHRGPEASADRLLETKSPPPPFKPAFLALISFTDSATNSWFIIQQFKETSRTKALYSWCFRQNSWKDPHWLGLSHMPMRDQIPTVKGMQSSDWPGPALHLTGERRQDSPSETQGERLSGVTSGDRRGQGCPAEGQ